MNGKKMNGNKIAILMIAIMAISVTVSMVGVSGQPQNPVIIQGAVVYEDSTQVPDGWLVNATDITASAELGNDTTVTSPLPGIIPQYQIAVNSTLIIEGHEIKACVRNGNWYGEATYTVQSGDDNPAVPITMPDIVVSEEAPTPDVVINEIMWDELEYIELYNNGSSEVPIEGWKITAGDGGTDDAVEITMDSGAVIPAGGYYLIADEGATAGITVDEIDAMNFNQGGEIVQLFNGDPATATLIDIANQNEAWFAGAGTDVGESMERTTPPGDGTVASNWYTSTGFIGGRIGTPGQQNSVMPPDETAPTTEVTVPPDTTPTPSGETVVRNSPVMLSFHRDDIGGVNNTGVAYTNYSMTGAATLDWTTEPGEADFETVEITEEGNTTVWYYSVDNAGNNESEELGYVPNVTVRIQLPDIIVTNIGPSNIFAYLTNVLTACVQNIGTGDITTGFNVNISVSDATGAVLYSNKVSVSSLNVDETKEVNLGNWKPAAVENITLTVIGDCDGAVEESDEGNNSMTEYRNTTDNCEVDTMMSGDCYGYRGQHSLQQIYGGAGNYGLIFTTGDHYYKHNMVNFTIGTGGDINNITGEVADIPADAEIKWARLYVYYCWRDNEEYGYPELGMTFSGNPVSEDVNYMDWKGWTTSTHYTYGTITYNVTSLVTGNGAYTANITNLTCWNAWKKGYTSGMALLIVYEHESSPYVEYYINEGYDRVATGYKETCDWQYHVTPEDATTTASFPCVEDAITATLFTATLDANVPGDKAERLYFNDVQWTSLWPADANTRPIGTDSRDVTTELESNEPCNPEIAEFQEGYPLGSNGFGAANAILVVEYDTTPPTITDVSPDDGATKVSRTTTISATFSEAMNTTSAEAAFSVDSVTGAFSWSSDKKTMTFTPSSALAYNTKYTVTISTAAKDEAGNPLAAYSWSFTTKSKSTGGGGGGAPRDTDGDGYSDIQEMIAGTDKDDPCDPDPECAACLATEPAATPTPTVAPTAKPTAKPTTPPAPTPEPTATPEDPGFEAVLAIAGLLAVAYLALRRKRK